MRAKNFSPHLSSQESLIMAPGPFSHPTKVDCSLPTLEQTTKSANTAQGVKIHFIDSGNPLPSMSREETYDEVYTRVRASTAWRKKAKDLGAHSFYGEMELNALMQEKDRRTRSEQQRKRRVPRPKPKPQAAATTSIDDADTVPPTDYSSASDNEGDRSRRPPPEARSITPRSRPAIARKGRSGASQTQSLRFRRRRG